MVNNFDIAVPAKYTDMNNNRTIPLETLSQMISVINPAATIHEAELAQSGHLSVYHLVIETPTRATDWVLKASPDGERHGIDTEARLLSIVEDQTSIPVPTVLGAVDAHETLPAPYFLMESVNGIKVPKREIGELSDKALKRMSRQTGRYLAELHSLDGPEGYGQVDIVPSQSLEGGRPSVDLNQLTITDLQGGSSTDSNEWPAVLRMWAENTLERHVSTRFEDMTEEIRSIVLERIESMEGPFRPVLGRIDHGLHNLLLEPETGAITGMIDWAFTLSVPGAYDLVCVEANLSLGPWSIHSATPDRRQLIRTNLLEGYQEIGQSVIVDQFQQHHATYELLALLRAMNHLDLVTEFVMPDATDEQVNATAQKYRNLVTDLSE